MFVQSLGVTKGLQNIPVCTNIMLFTLTPNHTTVITVGRHTSRSPHWPCTNERRTTTLSPSRRSRKPSLSLPQVRVFPSILFLCPVFYCLKINSYEHNVWLKALSLTIKFHSNSSTKIPFTTEIIAIKVRYLLLWDVRGEISLKGQRQLPWRSDFWRDHGFTRCTGRDVQGLGGRVVNREQRQENVPNGGTGTCKKPWGWREPSKLERLNEAWPAWHFCLGGWYDMRLHSRVGVARLFGCIRMLVLIKSGEAFLNNS